MNLLKQVLGSIYNYNLYKDFYNQLTQRMTALSVNISSLTDEQHEQKTKLQREYNVILRWINGIRIEGCHRMDQGYKHTGVSKT